MNPSNDQSSLRVWTPTGGGMGRRQFLRVGVAAAAGLWCAGRPVAAAGAGGATKLDNPFFPYAFEFNREHPLENGPQVLKELGYAGVALSGLTRFADTVTSYRAEGLHVFATYLGNSVAKDTAPSPVFRTAVKTLQGTGVTLWCAITGGTFEQMADRAVAFLREAADLTAAAGVTLALYPHASYCPAKASEAVELIRRAERPDVRVTLNLVHEGSGRLAAKGPDIIKEVLPHLHIATINGTAGIGPLGTGNFDVFGFLKQLKTAGYDGPIGLQTFGIKGPPREHLAQSIKTWREYQARFAAEQKEK